MDATIQEFGPGDVGWATALLTDDFGGPGVVSRGVLHDATTRPGFVARRGRVRVGLATYHVVADECEVVVVDGRGVGAPLLDAVVARARELGCRRCWLITTNDNTRALRFYQRQCWDLVAVHRDALAVSRRIKPGIPLLGLDGIALRHELELELLL